MKKIALFVSIAFVSMQLNAQKLIIYENFSGENCVPCAQTNPGLWVKMAANPDKVLMVKYQTPIPSAGPIYNLYKADSDIRRAYYSVNSAPNARANGQIIGGQTHPFYLTQTTLDTMSAQTADFNITASHSFFANG